MAFEQELALNMELGEGPIWQADQQTLYWVDIKGPALHRLTTADGTHQVVLFDEAITCVVADSRGGFVAACRSGLWRLNAAGEKEQRLVAAPYDTAAHRFNDGGCDPAGRFWIGAMNEGMDQADSALYRYDSRGLVPMADHMTITNGLAFSPDGEWLYHTDTPSRVIRRHAYDQATGEIDAGQPWVDLNRRDITGHPDGAAVDINGDYWVALFGGAAVARFDAAGTLVARYEMTAKNPTMPCFGGPDRRTLYVTTGWEHMTREEIERWPASGSLLSMPVDTPGLAKADFQPA